MQAQQNWNQALSKLTCLIALLILSISCAPAKRDTLDSTLKYSDKGIDDIYDFRKTVPPYACEKYDAFYESVNGFHPCPRIVSAYVVGNNLFPQVGNSLSLMTGFALLKHGRFSIATALESELNSKQIDKLGEVMNKLHRRHKIKNLYNQPVDREEHIVTEERLQDQWKNGAMRVIPSKLLFMEYDPNMAEEEVWRAYWAKILKDLEHKGYLSRADKKFRLLHIRTALDDFIDYFIMLTSKEGKAKEISGKYSVARSEIYQNKSEKSTDEIFLEYHQKYVNFLREEYAREYKNFTYPKLTEYFLEYFIACLSNKTEVQIYQEKP